MERPSYRAVMSSPLLIAGCIAAIAAASSASAQGAVSGRITLLEQGGGHSTDLANAVIYLTRAGGVPGRAAPAQRINMVSREFMPAVRIVPAGTRVEFPNDDPFRHNVFSNAGPGAFDLGLYGRGESRGYQFGRPGVYPIFCNIHARMVAFVLAVPTPYFAPAGADGRFTLMDVPPGRYRLHVWHDRGGEHSREIDVPSSGVNDLNVTLDARSHRAQQHRNKYGQEYRAVNRDRY